MPINPVSFITSRMSVKGTWGKKFHRLDPSPHFTFRLTGMRLAARPNPAASKAMAARRVIRVRSSKIGSHLTMGFGIWRFRDNHQENALGRNDDNAAGRRTRALRALCLCGLLHHRTTLRTRRWHPRVSHRPADRRMEARAACRRPGESVLPDDFRGSAAPLFGAWR